MSNSTAYSIDPTTWRTFDLLQQVIDTFDDPIFVKDLQHRWIAANAAFCAILGHSHAEMIGKSDIDFFPPEQARIYWAGDNRVFTSGMPDASDETQTRSDGQTTTIWTRKWPLRDKNEAIIGLCGIITDITVIKQRQDAVMQLEHELAERAKVIEAQMTLLDQLGIPIIQVWDHVLLVPLIATMDSRRANLLIKNMLESISQYHAQVIILDITGVPIVDTTVADALLQSIQAAELLGCRSILVGIRPEIAQTVVGLGVDFSRIITRARLQDGLAYALRMLQYRILHDAS